MLGLTTPRRKAFSLVELVIVIVILGIIGAIAVPRMSAGASGAGESAFVTDLAALRNAIELYAAEHAGTYPTTAKIVEQLTEYTDAAGANSATPDSTHIYGPYLHAIPTLKVSTNRGKNGIDGDGTGATTGWVYTATTGVIVANSAELSSDGATKFNEF